MPVDADYVRRCETSLEDLRRRNGELFLALTDVAPDIAQSFAPATDWPSRYVVLDRLITRAVDVGLKAGALEDYSGELRQLVEAVLASEDYWRDVAAERARRDEIAERGRQTREFNKNNKGSDSNA